MWLSWSGRPADVGETSPAPSPRTWARLALLHPSLVWAQGMMEKVAIALPHSLSMVPFLPQIPHSALPCPASTPSLSPELGLRHPPQEGTKAERWLIHQSHGNCSSLPCGQFTAHPGDAVQPPSALSRNWGLILLGDVVLWC